MSWDFTVLLSNQAYIIIREELSLHLMLTLGSCTVFFQVQMSVSTKVGTERGV